MSDVAGSCHIRVRKTKSGRRYIVRFRLGGREYAPIHAGSFELRKHAAARRDFILGELAAGRDPRESLRGLRAPEEKVKTLHERFDEFIASRIDVGVKTKALYRNARDQLRFLAERDPASLTPADVQLWVAALSEGEGPGEGRHSTSPSESAALSQGGTVRKTRGTADHRREPCPPSESAGLSPGTVAHYLADLRQVLDFCDLDPNPARNKKVKVPMTEDEEVVIPSNEEWLAIQRTLRPRSSLVLRLVEAEGLRISEAVGLLYGDVDFARGLLRVSKARTKRGTSGQRWLPVPRELLDELAALCPLEDRERERRVFPGLTDSQVRRDLALACRDAGVAHYWPHALRHRRCSLWLAHGFETVQIKVWSGHSKASLLTDIYGHVVIDARADAWREFWVGVYMDERRERVGLHGERETA